MAVPTPTGELIGQEITINYTEQVDDYYMGQLQVDLSTEYDLTKGVDITFDGQLYKNVPVHYVKEDRAIVIGEFINDEPVINKYPFFIVLLINEEEGGEE